MLAPLGCGGERCSLLRLPQVLSPPSSCPLVLRNLFSSLEIFQGQLLQEVFLLPPPLNFSGNGKSAPLRCCGGCGAAPHPRDGSAPKGQQGTRGKAALGWITLLLGAEVNLHDNKLQYIRKMLVKASGSN